MPVTQFRARYVNGILEPLESLELEDGAEVLVSVVPTSVGVRPSGRTFGAWRGLLDADELKSLIYESRSRVSV